MRHLNDFHAVLDEDLRDLLCSIGELEPIVRGERFCGICHTLVTVQNVQMIIPLKGGRFEFICDKPECVEASAQTQLLP